MIHPKDYVTQVTEEDQELVEDDIDKLLQRGTIKKAKMFAKLNSVYESHVGEGKRFSVLSTSPNQLAKLGIGIELYFG